ncbi:hypothetical protein BDZ45DRAFT_196510 [Acephala macrosclerotiorum]|nr:hypothetical protein BDZ45DRAFT_196510 [Acephala macrosclerotiorum]
MARADKSALVIAAVDAFRRGDYASSTAAAHAKGVHFTAVQRRLNGLTRTRREANAFYYQCLTNTEEELLIARINELINRGMPLTSQIVKNLAEEIRGKELAQVIEKYHITADNIYNFDEKGFLIGMARTMKRIMSLEAYKSGRVTKNKQDGNREFISLLACVSAIGRAISLLLIYRGANSDLQNT